MFVEPLRIVTSWLGDGTYGVNAKLAALTPDGTDAVPPNVALITSEVDDDRAAQGLLPATLPCLVVTYPETIGLRTMVETSHRDAPSATLAIRYACQKQATRVATRDALYTLRATLRSLKDLMGAPGNAARTRNQVALVNTTDDARFVPLFQPVEDQVVTAGLLLTWTIRDLSP